MRDKDKKLFAEVNQALESLSAAISDSGFIEPFSIESLRKNNAHAVELASRRSRSISSRLGLVDECLKRSMLDLQSRYDSFPNDVHSHNLKLAERLSVDVGKLINPVEGRNLDEQQLTSIAMDVNTRLIIAGAGTGKTTTIVGLVKDLLMTGKARPEEILLLSFTNASVNELRERIFNETSERIDTTTFHRLGLRTIAIMEGKMPSVSHIDLNKFIIEDLQNRSDDAQYLTDLNSYIAYDFNSQRDEFSFDTEGEYERYILENPLITFKGETVKSFGEADIANFLAMSGIPYTYEGQYPVDTSDEHHGRYYPDFHIDGTNIYIEYFGIDRCGNVAKFIGSSEEYNQSIIWKREVHKTYGTELIELFAYNLTLTEASADGF